MKTIHLIRTYVHLIYVSYATEFVIQIEYTTWFHGMINIGLAYWFILNLKLLAFIQSRFEGTILLDAQ